METLGDNIVQSVKQDLFPQLAQASGALSQAPNVLSHAPNALSQASQILQQVPQVPQMPQAPQVPQTPQVPQMSQVPQTPQVPQVPQTFGTAQMQQVPQQVVPSLAGQLMSPSTDELIDILGYFKVPRKWLFISGFIAGIVVVYILWKKYYKIKHLPEETQNPGHILNGVNGANGANGVSPEPIASYQFPPQYHQQQIPQNPQNMYDVQQEYINPDKQVYENSDDSPEIPIYENGENL